MSHPRAAGATSSKGDCHLSWRRSTLGSVPWIHDDCTSGQVRVTNSHAFLSGSCHNHCNDYSISPFYFSALLGNTAQTKVLFQFKIVHCLLNLGEVWIIKRVILDKSALPKSVVFAWVLDLILMDTKEMEKKNKEFCGKGRNQENLAKFPVSQDSHCLAW